jgi:hypothetical protein
MRARLMRAVESKPQFTSLELIPKASFGENYSVIFPTNFQLVFSNQGDFL